MFLNWNYPGGERRGWHLIYISTRTRSLDEDLKSGTPVNGKLRHVCGGEDTAFVKTV